MTKAEARQIARERADSERIVYAVVRHKSRFKVMTLGYAVQQGFYVRERIDPAPKNHASNHRDEGGRG